METTTRPFDDMTLLDIWTIIEWFNIQNRKYPKDQSENEITLHSRLLAEAERREANNEN